MSLAKEAEKLTGFAAKALRKNKLNSAPAQFKAGLSAGKVLKARSGGLGADLSGRVHQGPFRGNEK